jgi:hypothetical protein
MADSLVEEVRSERGRVRVAELGDVIGMPARAAASIASLPGAAVDGISSLFTDKRPLADEEHRRLLMLASARATPRWNLATAKNAHATNTPGEMEQALRGDYDVLEGDLRIDGTGRLVMAHEPWQVDGMTFDQWLELGARSGRGLKIDVKEPEAIGPMMRLLARSGVPDNPLILNVPIGRDGAASARVGELRLIRKLAPNATINLSNQRYPYDDSQLAQLREAADFVGGRVMFPLRSDEVNERVTRELSPHGLVAAWNLPQIDSPSNVLRERARLRRLGVDGTIDIRTGREVPFTREVMSLAASARERVASWLG